MKSCPECLNPCRHIRDQKGLSHNLPEKARRVPERKNTDAPACVPVYGDRDSSIQDTISSIERLKQIPATIWLTCHETGIFEENPGDLWDQYLAVIDHRESRLLDYLNEPRTMADIVDAWIVYQRPREPKEFYALAEEMIMQKHLDLLVANSAVVKEGERYVRID